MSPVSEPEPEDAPEPAFQRTITFLPSDLYSCPLSVTVRTTVLPFSSLKWLGLSPGLSSIRWPLRRSIET